MIASLRRREVDRAAPLAAVHGKEVRGLAPDRRRPPRACVVAENHFGTPGLPIVLANFRAHTVWGEAIAISDH